MLYGAQYWSLARAYTCGKSEKNDLFLQIYKRNICSSMSISEAENLISSKYTCTVDCSIRIYNHVILCPFSHDTIHTMVFVPFPSESHPNRILILHYVYYDPLEITYHYFPYVCHVWGLFNTHTTRTVCSRWASVAPNHTSPFCYPLDSEALAVKKIGQ